MLLAMTTADNRSDNVHGVRSVGPTIFCSLAVVLFFVQGLCIYLEVTGDKVIAVTIGFGAGALVCLLLFVIVRPTVDPAKRGTLTAEQSRPVARKLFWLAMFAMLTTLYTVISLLATVYQHENSGTLAQLVKWFEAPVFILTVAAWSFYRRVQRPT